MAKITRMVIGRTVNIGNYENVKFDLEVTLDPEDKAEEVWTKLKSTAEAKAAAIKKGES